MLVVSDAGDGFSHDWATWIRPRIVLADGKEKQLTDLEWKSATSGYGKAQKNANCMGGRLLVRGKPIENGIGVHATSKIVFALPNGAKRFLSEGALDDGGTVRDGTVKTPTSVQFSVWNDANAASSVKTPQPASQGESRDPSNAVSSLDLHDEVEVQLFASEPMITSPSSMDIDSRGRVWLCDVVNYRRNQGKRPDGDRILILEDRDQDGAADEVKVFYQGQDVNSAHGICVLGDRVIVSAGNEIFSLYDRDGDDVADPESKELLFTNIGGAQHDHGIHAVHFGPDGRLYFNFGNTGKRLCDPKGELITDIHGVRCTTENNRPYQEGMIFRCEPDGSQVEVLAWNFRNNWEVCVDSFGSLWQSDNDDDGNKAVRINFVMEFGNYGYKDERTGAGWRSPRPGMSDEIPLRHWYLNDPGVVPNLLQTGAGSPTGICVYEGDLLPSVFHNQIIHCDAGPNVVRAYPVEPEGAGYSARMENLIQSTRDRWFRPSDVSVAPDGSLFVADWYDPGVGGHGMGDIERGRIFRVIPKDHPTTRDYKVAESADPIDQLQSPNAATRFLGWTALAEKGDEAIPGLRELFEKSKNPRIQARALWFLARTSAGEETLEAALKSPVEDLRITAIRAARQIHTRKQMDAESFLGFLREAYESSLEYQAVAREIFLSLRFLEGNESHRLWSDLARDHSPEDRWMLEAAGIGAERFWKERTDAFFEYLMPYHQYTGYLWRSRSPDTATRITKELLKDPKKRTEYEPSPLAYLRALELLPFEEEKEEAYRALYTEAASEIALIAASQLGPDTIANLPGGPERLDELLAPIRGTAELVKLAERLDLRGLDDDLADFIQANPEAGDSVTAARLLLHDKNALQKRLESSPMARSSLLVRALGKTGDRSVASLLGAFLDRAETPAVLKIEIVNAMAMNGHSGRELLKRAQEKKLDPALVSTAALALARSADSRLRNEAAQILPLPVALGADDFPSLQELAQQKGDPSKGPQLYEKATCATCHQIDGKGIAFGPDLSEIGNKLSRVGLFEAILYPNAAISHGFHGVNLTRKDGSQVLGYVTGETDHEIALRIPGGGNQSIPRNEIEAQSELEQSLMPPGLGAVIGAEGLVDLVSWLETLK